MCKYNELCSCCEKRKKENKEVYLLYIDCQLDGIYKNQAEAVQLLEEHLGDLQPYHRDESWIDKKEIK